MPVRACPASGERGAEHRADPAGADRADARAGRLVVQRACADSPQRSEWSSAAARRPRARRRSNAASASARSSHRHATADMGPATVCTRSDARPSAAPQRALLDRDRLHARERHEHELRSSAAARRSTIPPALAKPLRRHENGRSQAARRGGCVKPASPPRPVRPASTSGSIVGRRRRAAGARARGARRRACRPGARACADLRRCCVATTARRG